MDREYMGGAEVVPWIANMILYFLVNILWFLSTNILTNISTKSALEVWSAFCIYGIALYLYFVYFSG